MRGKIIKGVGGFYYVFAEDRRIYECRARGIFRRRDIKPLVGDDVIFCETENTDGDYPAGSIDELLPRKNSLLRPAVANVDQALAVFAAASPKPDFNLADRLLISLQQRGITPIICFNKSDLAEGETLDEYRRLYEGAGYEVFITSTASKNGIDALSRKLEGRTTALAGPSGVGKSSLINILAREASMETGEISRKISRGKHTTRHSEFFPLKTSGYIFDTPGFSSVFLPDIEKEELERFFPEIYRCSDRCRFIGCAHISEPDCAVKAALEAGEISGSRYENYKLFYEELKNKRRY